MTQSLFPELGIGVGLRPQHYGVFLNGRPRSVSWVEVISENFMAWHNGERPLRAMQTLEQVRRNYSVVLHGVSLNVGSADPLDKKYLTRLKRLVERIEPAWVSDHLCWTGVDGENTHDLLPIPYTGEALQLIVNKIERVQERLGRRILIENPSSYVTFSHSEMTEWEFLTELSRKSDCAILLDINNIYVSSVNHGFDPVTYIRAIPKSRVGQIHLAGHSKVGRHLIDTHDTPVCDEVWDLYEVAVRRFGCVSAMIERDGNIPDWREMEAEIHKIRRIQNGFKSAAPEKLAALF